MTEPIPICGACDRAIEDGSTVKLEREQVTHLLCERCLSRLSVDLLSYEQVSHIVNYLDYRRVRRN